jgi:hypothetical protein
MAQKTASSADPTNPGPLYAVAPMGSPVVPGYASGGAGNMPQQQYAAAPLPQPQLPGVDPMRARFQAFCAANEVSPAAQDDLFGVLTTSRVVLILDDSGSMATTVVQPGQSPWSAGPQITRWNELERLSALLVNMITSTTPEGLDCHFLNRGSYENITSPAQLAPLFATGPHGGTPLITAFRRVFAYPKYLADLQSGRRVIVVVVTDGEPSDGNPGQLFMLLSRGRPAGFHVSLAECNDNEEVRGLLCGAEVATTMRGPAPPRPPAYHALPPSVRTAGDGGVRRVGLPPPKFW